MKRLALLFAFLAAACSLNDETSVRRSALDATLVAAYHFNEGSGMVLHDVTANHLDGSLAGQTWTASGKNGGALTFNANMVTVLDAAPLDLTNGMTLEAWVYPTVTLSGEPTVIFKEAPGSLAYAMYATNPANHPNAWITYNGSFYDVAGGTKPAKNVWTHLTATYDAASAVMKVYVNGVLRGTRDIGTNRLITTSDGVLRLGGNSIWSNEWFRGRIDDVRIYNRALSAAEIVTDMNTPVVEEGGTGTGGATGTGGTGGAAGASGTSGTGGTAGASGTTGTGGAAGEAGTTGTGGAAGASGTTGTGGAAGEAGTTGTGGAAGEAGTTGTGGAAGEAGTTGTGGAAGASGTTGTGGAAGEAGTTGTGGAAGTGGVAGTTGTGGAAGATGGGGSGGLRQPPLVEYPIDEAASGQIPTFIHDSQPSPLNSNIVYVGTTPQFTETSGMRGLYFPLGDIKFAGAFSPQLDIGNKVFDMLDGARQVTIEVVMELQSNSAYIYQIFGISQEDGENDDFMIWRWDDRIEVDFTSSAGYPAGYYKRSAPLSSIPAGIHIIHAVLDTPAALEADRLRLYVDGVRVTLEPSNDGIQAIPLNVTMNIPRPNQSWGYTGPNHFQQLALGGFANYYAGTGGFRGKIYFAAIHRDALNAAEIAGAPARILNIP